MKLDPKYAAAKKALRDVRNTMRFANGLTKVTAAAEMAVAEPQTPSPAAEPVAL